MPKREWVQLAEAGSGGDPLGAGRKLMGTVSSLGQPSGKQARTGGQGFPQAPGSWDLDIASPSSGPDMPQKPPTLG